MKESNFHRSDQNRLHCHYANPQLVEQHYVLLKRQRLSKLYLDQHLLASVSLLLLAQSWGLPIGQNGDSSSTESLIIFIFLGCRPLQLERYLENWWVEKDLNLRTHTRADLQSTAFNRSAIYPLEFFIFIKWWTRGESNSCPILTHINLQTCLYFSSLSEPLLGTN